MKNTSNRYAFVDIETTGTSPKTGRITEVAMMLVKLVYELFSVLFSIHSELVEIRENLES